MFATKRRRLLLPGPKRNSPASWRSVPAAAARAIYTSSMGYSMPTGAWLPSWPSVMQAGGVAMITLGFALPHQHLVRNRKAQLSVVPHFSEQYQGVSVLGWF
jgi:hypothetical protein